MKSYTNQVAQSLGFFHGIGSSRNDLTRRHSVFCSAEYEDPCLVGLLDPAQRYVSAFMPLELTSPKPPVLCEGWHLSSPQMFHFNWQQIIPNPYFKENYRKHNAQLDKTEEQASHELDLCHEMQKPIAGQEFRSQNRTLLGVSHLHYGFICTKVTKER